MSFHADCQTDIFRKTIESRLAHRNVLPCNFRLSLPEQFAKNHIKLGTILILQKQFLEFTYVFI